LGDQEAGPQLDGDCPGRRLGVHHGYKKGAIEVVRRLNT
jgi:hypothetical protein